MKKWTFFKLTLCFSLSLSYPYIWLKHNQRSGWWHRWQRQWWWSGGGSEGKELWGWWRGPPGLSHRPRDERKMYSSHFPPFPLTLFFSSKRATDTRIATLEIVFCYCDHLTTFTGTEELAYYLIQFLFCTINVLSGTYSRMLNLSLFNLLEWITEN